MSKGKLTMPKGTSVETMEQLRDKIGSWHIVHSVRIEGLEILWVQTTMCGTGAESISALFEGLMFGYNLKPQKSQITLKYDHSMEN